MSLPTWARKETFAVQRLNQVRNSVGSNVDTWTDTDETLVCSIQSADDAAVNLAGARGRTVTVMAFTNAPVEYEPEAVRLVGAKTWLVRTVLETFTSHSVLGLEQSNAS